MDTKCPKQSMNLPVYVFKVRLYFISNGVIVLGSQDGFQMGRKAEAAGWRSLAILLSWTSGLRSSAEHMAAIYRGFSVSLAGGCDRQVCEQKWASPLQPEGACAPVAPSSLPPLAGDDENGSHPLDPQVWATCWAGGPAPPAWIALLQPLRTERKTRLSCCNDQTSGSSQIGMQALNMWIGHTRPSLLWKTSIFIFSQVVSACNLKKSRSASRAAMDMLPQQEAP